MTKQFFASIMVLTLVAMVVGVVAQAGTEATVSSTVTAKLVSVSISGNAIVYGTLNLSTTKNTVQVNATQTATNNGNVNVNLGIKSSDALGGTTWELAISAGLDAFTHGFSTNGVSPWAPFDIDNNTYSTLASAVTPGNSQTFDLEIGTPTSSTDKVEHTVTVTVLATE